MVSSTDSALNDCFTVPVVHHEVHHLLRYELIVNKLRGGNQDGESCWVMEEWGSVVKEEGRLRERTARIHP